MASSNHSEPTTGNSPVERDVFIHDLKNVMTGALGHLSLARRRAAFNQEISESLSAVENILRGACSMAEGALRPKASSVDEELSVLDVVSTSAAICIPPDRFTLRLTYGENLPMVRAKAEKLKQLFNNLLTNSVHAMGEGGRISVHLERQVPDRRADDEKVMVIKIRDEGPGIPSEIRQQIFEPGFSTRPGGSGVGLSSVKTFLGEIGGEISLDPEVKSGAGFVLSVPGLNRIDPRTRPVEVIPLGSSGRALVLDDDEMVLQIVEEMLDYLGWNVVTSSDGSETVELYREAKEAGDPFRFVILDLNVPAGIGGTETADQIWSYDPAARLYISSGQETAVLKNPSGHGYAGSLKKPYTLEELSGIVAGAKLE